MIITKWFLLVLGLLCVLSTAYATNYYVSDGGSDTSIWDVGEFVFGGTTSSEANPQKILFTNDGDIDVYGIEYAMALASSGEIDLVGIVADCGSGTGGNDPEPYVKTWEYGKREYDDIVGKAIRSGMINIPSPVAGSHWALERPASGEIADTIPIDTPGSRLIIEKANEATPENPLYIVTGGPLTSVADAYLINPSIADKIIVVSVLGDEDEMSGYNAAIDYWATYIVLEKLQSIQCQETKFLPIVMKADLPISDIPDTELRRFMIHKDPYGVNIEGRGGDTAPLLSLICPDYILETKTVSFDHWEQASSGGTGYDKMPVFRDDPNGITTIIVSASVDIGTEEWWRVVENPAAYTGTIIQQSPYVNHIIPGTINAVDFDHGGKGSGFYNPDWTSWSLYRLGLNMDVPRVSYVGTTEEIDGKFILKNIRAGDWWEYTIDVPEHRHYDIELVFSSEVNTGSIVLEIDGLDVTSTINLPNTGDLYDWQTITVCGIDLDAGKSTLRVKTSTGGFNFNRIAINYTEDVNSGFNLTPDGRSAYINTDDVFIIAENALYSTGWSTVNFTVKENATAQTHLDVDFVFGFNTSELKPEKAQLYKPHWDNTTSQHEHTFYNVYYPGNLSAYVGDDLDYGNSYNDNATFPGFYTIVHEVATYNKSSMEQGTKWISSNFSCDSYELTNVNGGNLTIYWHTRHDQFVDWLNIPNDRFITIPESYHNNYDGKNKWYGIKDQNITVGKEYQMRIWVDVPVKLGEHSYKYDIVVKPSSMDFSQAKNAGYLYVLDPWFNTSWNYFKMLTLNQTMINQTIGNVHYTMLVELSSDSDLAAKAQADADDIVFVNSANTTQLDHHISSFNSTTGALVAYVNVTDISNVTSINMYYNNSGATDTQDTVGTWGVNASCVWLFDEGTGSYVNDSSGNDNNGTIVGADWVADGLDFNGVSDRVDVGQIVGQITGANPRTIILPFAADVFGADTGECILTYTPGSSGAGWWVFAEDQAISIGFNGHRVITPKTDLSTGVQYTASLVVPGGATHTADVLIYIDGVNQSLSNEAGSSRVLNTDTTNVKFASDESPGNYFNGQIPFILIYNRAFSADEIATTYNNSNSPSLFISVGAEQSDAAVSEYIPPAPISLANTTGNFWVNFTWSEDSGNVTDSYNVSQNGTWVNGSSIAFNNSSVGAHGYSNIIVYAYNSTGTGTLSSANVTDNVTITNNAIIISDVSASYFINEGETLSIDANYTDADGDIGTFADNSTEWNIDSGTGVVSWVTVDGDDGTYNYYINVSDGYGSTNQYNFTVTVNDTIFSPTVTLLSQYPLTLYQNTTGNFNLSWGITHSTAGINNTSVAMIYTLYDVVNTNHNNSVRLPSNNRSALCTFLSEYVLRADNRNNSLNFEDNATITEGNIYKWGGADENTTRLTITPVNSTYTKIYWNGTAQDSVWPGSWYLDRTDQTTATMTGQNIDKSNHVLLQSTVPGCGAGQTGQLLDMYVDTYPGVTDPVKPITIYYLNYSYDPLGTVNPESSPYAYLVTTMNATQWHTDDYVTGNSSYVNSITVNTSAISDAGITPTTKFYVYFNTEAATSKSYYMNKSDSATSTNRTFAQTETMWIGDNAPYTAHAYTPNVWFVSRSYESQYKTNLYVADNNGLWNNSGIQTSNIEVSAYPPSTPGICSFYYHDAIDYDMNGTYNGEYYVRVLTSNDPDGGTVNHNLTLHYANQTLISTINNTITGNGVWCINVTFDSSTYYSLTEEYTLRVVATDDESITSEYWLPVNFSLYATPDPTTLSNTTYNFGVNYTWAAGGGAVSDSYNVSLNTTWYNGSSQAWANNSTTPHGSIEIIVYAYNDSSGLSAGNITDNITIPNNAITITNTSDDSVNEGENVYVDYDATDTDSDTPTFSCNRTDLFTDFITSAGTGNWTTGFADAGTYYVDFGVSDGYGSTDNYTMTITVSEAGAPGIPTNLQNTTGNFWVNYTWDAGANTDSYNVSQNSTWVNGSYTAFNNSSVGAHGWSNITVHGYNSTSDQTSAGTSQNTQVPNNAITLVDISASYSIDEGDTLSIDTNVTDADGDSPTFDDNATEWNINAATGIVSWVTGDGDDGTYYYYINVSDGYGSSDKYNFTVTVNDTMGLSYIPPDPISLANSTGNFWVNYTWSVGAGNVTDSYNVSQNTTWVNGSYTAFNNSSVGPHGTSTIIVYAYNDTDRGAISTGYITDSVTVPNNVPVLTGIPDQNTNEDTSLYDVIDLDTYFSDADGDSPTFAVQSNNQSANVTIDISGANTVDFILAANWHGTAQIVFNVTDGYGGSDTDTMILTVYSVNDPPVMDPIGPITEYENETVIIDVDATDPDDDTLTYACNRTDLFTDFSTSNGIGTWTTNYSSAGVYYVNFSVDDGNSGEDYEVVTITIIDVPLAISTYWNNDTRNSLSVSVEPGDTVLFGVTTNRTPNNISWYNGSTFLENDTATSQGNLTHHFSTAGTYYINVSAEDAYDTTANTTFTVSVGYAVPSVITYSPATPYRSNNDTNVSFNVTFSQTGNITWYLDNVQIQTNNTTTSASYLNTSPIIGGPYNVTAAFTNDNGSVSQTWAWTVTTPLDNNIPLPIFIMWSVIMCAGALIGFMSTGLIGITSSLLTITIAYMNSKAIINGNVVQYFGGISSTDTIVTGSRTIESLPLSYIYLFIAIVMFIVFILHAKNEIIYQIQPDIEDIDYE